jgi:hypothetical protein
MAADIRRGSLSRTQVRWLVALATVRAESQVTGRYPDLEADPAVHGDGA